MDMIVFKIQTDGRSFYEVTPIFLKTNSVKCAFKYYPYISENHLAELNSSLLL